MPLSPVEGGLGDGGAAVAEPRRALPCYGAAAAAALCAQGICPPEEWESFMEALRRPLPTTFRINGSGAGRGRGA